MRNRLSGELIAILVVGATLAGIMLAGHAGLHDRMDRMEARFTGRIDGHDERLTSVEEKVTRLEALDIGTRLRALEDGQAALRESLARIEGLLTGLLERLRREDAPDG